MDCTFKECVSLENVYLPDGVSYIGNQAFKRCAELQSIKIPIETSYIGQVYDSKGASNCPQGG